MTEIEIADRLYQGFPDFAAWGPLPAEDIDLWNRFAANLEERRTAATPEALKKSLEVAVRAAALDTGAIEGLYTVDRGFTMTVAVQGLAWEQMIQERGAGVRELFEAQLEAYELVLDAVTHKLPMTEAWIRALHETLCAPQETHLVLTAAGWQEQELPKGRYKTQPNHVRLQDGSFHAYAPVDQVPSEMHRLIEQVSTPEFEAAHPVLQASYIHYALVVIHPFADGNGRVARALASVFFYRACSIPLLVFANHKPGYLDTLHRADLGDLRPLILFFRDRGIDTMQLVSESLMTAETAPADEVAARLRSLVAPGQSLSPVEMDAIALRLLDRIEDLVESEINRLGLSSTISVRVQKTESEPMVVISLETQVPVRARVTNFFRVRVTSDPSRSFPFLVQSSGVSDDLAVRLQDLHPEISEGLRLRLIQWVSRQLSRIFEQFEKQAIERSTETEI